MPVFVTSRTFYDEFTELAGGGVNYLAGCLGDKISCEIKFYVKASVESSLISFTVADKSIALTNDTIDTDFITAGFHVGDSIQVVDSASNDGTYVIETISDNGRIITTVGGLIGTEVVESCNIYGVTNINDVDLYFNLVENDSPESYYSLLDNGTQQRMSVRDIDLTGGTADFYYTTNSKSWQYGTASITRDQDYYADYRQAFTLTQEFILNPIYLSSQTSNFENGIPPAPEYYQDRKCLKHIFRIDAKYEHCDPNIPHTGGLSEVKGNTSWFDEMLNGEDSIYSSVVTYTDFTTSDVVDSIQRCEKTNVSIVLTATDPVFCNTVDCKTKFIIQHQWTPANEESYINKRTNFIETLFYDRATAETGDTGINGDNFGTDYQVLTDIDVTYNSTTQVTITFTIDLSDTIKDSLSEKDSNDLKYILFITTQPWDEASSVCAERTAIKIDYNDYYCDEDDDTLFGLQDYLRFYKYPNEQTNPTNTIASRYGNYWLNNTRFWVSCDVSGSNSSPTLLDTTIKIVATKSGQDDFVLEEKVFDSSTFRKLDGIQDISIESTKGYILPDGSPFNQCKLIRNPALDTNSKAYYSLYYGIAIRYEYWLQAIQEAQGNQNAVFEDVDEVTEDWSNYPVDGWDIKYKLTWRIEGTDGHITTFESEADIDVATNETAPTEGSTFTGVLRYYDEDGNEINSVVEDGITTIEATFTGDTSVFPSGTFPTGSNGFSGYIYCDDENSGSVANRRWASSEANSENNNPFEAADDPMDGDSKASDNLRLTVYDDRIVLSTFFDISIYNQRNISQGSLEGRVKNNTGVMFYTGIDYLGEICLLLQDDGTPLLTADLEGILINC